MDINNVQSINIITRFFIFSRNELVKYVKLEYLKSEFIYKHLTFGLVSKLTRSVGQDLLALNLTLKEVLKLKLCECKGNIRF